MPVPITIEAKKTEEPPAEHKEEVKKKESEVKVEEVKTVEEPKKAVPESKELSPEQSPEQPSPQPADHIKVEGDEEGPDEDNKEGDQEQEEDKEEGEQMEPADLKPAQDATATGASANLKAIIDGIKQKVTETGQLYEDPDFPANDSSLYKDSTNLPEYTKDCPIVDWKRPQELVAVIL